ncbi:MAG: CRISPR-associated helicase Cas3' [Kiritimatiellales bacterium]|nr:CRISPR-associated helicase Cas3' [Kiritimatiellales bacterium]
MIAKLAPHFARSIQLTFYAHSKENQPPETWQPLDEHLKNVADLAADFAKPFESEDWAWDAGWLHDLGKATNAFQAYLRRCNELDDSEYDADGSISNHASAGAAWAEEQQGALIGRILAYLSAGHHAGLPDWYSTETGNAALPCRLEEGQRNLEYIRDFSKSVAANLKTVKRPPGFVKVPADFHLWIRMLFSCLTDADFLDTERFMSPDRVLDRGAFPNIGTLADRFFQALDKLEQDAPKTSVNLIRSEIRQACEAAAIQQRGLFSLSVPTGGGKTLSAVAFALRHVLHHKQHGFRRIIYVIPYTSIIEQTAKTLSGIFGRESVVEHHSNLSPEKETTRSRMAAENWDAPIIVTTNVQFFESLFSAKSSRCRKLHNMVNSIVILDEAQLLPTKWLAPCVTAINQLVKNYGVTLILATATQPALPGLNEVTEIIPAELNLYERLKRTDIRFPQDMSRRTEWKETAEVLKSHEQVLCVVNTRRDCYDLFRLMPEGTIHLSALMCGRHRSAVIRLIKNRLRKGLPIRVVSTQLVEAGVDIDFPSVYRALAGLDSVAQAAGRCNREGRLNDEGALGQVHVFIPPKPAPPGLLRKGEDKLREMASVAGFDSQNPEVFERYFKLFYTAVNDTGAAWLHDLLVKDAIPNLAFQFRTAGQQFQIIEDQGQRVVFVRYGKSEKWLKQLSCIGPTRENMRALQRYSVNLSKWNFERAKADGLIEDLWKEEYWCWVPEYDRCIGLDIFGGGWSPSDLIQ